MEEYLLHIAVRHILQRIEVAVVGRNLNTALPTGGAIEILCARVVHHATVDGEVVIMETFVHRAVGSAYPHPFAVLMQHGATGSTQSEAHNHRLGIRSLHAEACIAL